MVRGAAAAAGTYSEFKAKAIGSGSEGAQATLQDKYRDDLTLAEAENLSFEILKQVMEEKISNVNVEVASVTEEVHPCVSTVWV
jgi:20S proteasome subunit alpha 5